MSVKVSNDVNRSLKVSRLRLTTCEGEDEDENEGQGEGEIEAQPSNQTTFTPAPH